MSLTVYNVVVLVALFMTLLIRYFLLIHLTVVVHSLVEDGPERLAVQKSVQLKKKQQLRGRCASGVSCSENQTLLTLLLCLSPR